MRYNILARQLATNCKPIDISLYYDVLSPYSWFCFEVLQRYEAHWKDVNIILKPALNGGIIKAISAIPPSRSKIINMRQDLHRGRKYFNVPIMPIKNVGEIIAKGSMLPMRFLTATSVHQKDYLVEASRAFWMRRYNKDEDISTPDDIRELGNLVGMPKQTVESLLEASVSQEIKDALKNTTSEALNYGAFGVPTMVTEINGKMEMFFGSDRVHILAQEIGKEWKGPNPPKNN